MVMVIVVGVIDNNGKEIYSDKVGLLIARSLAPNHKKEKFIVDIKSTVSIFKMIKFFQKTVVKLFIGKQATHI